MIYIPTGLAILGLALMFAAGAALCGVAVSWWYQREPDGELEAVLRDPGVFEEAGLAHCPGCAHRYGTCPCRPGERCGCPEDMVTTVGPVDITSDSIPVIRDEGRDEDTGEWARQMAAELGDPVGPEWDEVPVPRWAQTRIATEAAVDVAKAMAEMDQDAAEFMASLVDRRIAIGRGIAA